MHSTTVLLTLCGVALTLLAMVGSGLGASIQARDASGEPPSSGTITLGNLLSGFRVVRTYAKNTNISVNAVADESIGPLCDILAYRDLIAAAVASSSTLDDNIATLLTLLDRTAEDACLVYQNLTNASASEEVASNVTAELTNSTCSLDSEEMLKFRMSCMSIKLYSTVNAADQSTSDLCDYSNYTCIINRCPWARSVFDNVEDYNEVEEILTKYSKYYCS